MESDKLEITEQKKHARCDMHLLSSIRNVLYKESKWYDNEHFAIAALKLEDAIDELAEID